MKLYAVYKGKKRIEGLVTDKLSMAETWAGYIRKCYSVWELEAKRIKQLEPKK